MNTYLIKKLKEGRLAKGLKQSDVANLINVKGNTLSNYENGVSEPDIDTFCALCDIYDLDPSEILGEAYGLNVQGSDFDIKPSEIEHVKKYRALSDYGRETIDYLIDRELNRPVEAEYGNEAEIIRIYPFLHNVASAGVGDYIADIPLDSIEAPYIKNADFVIGVCGDSMEPDFHNGEKLYVQKTDSLNVGDIGIFKKDGSLFLKEAGTDRLISHNGDYPDVYADSDNISVVGKVLGKVSN